MGIDAEMFVRTKEPVTQEQVKSWAYHLGSSFGSNRFWIWHEDKRHCLQIVDEYKQDGDSIYPEPGETFIRVYPATRYYDKGYERGDLPFLIMLAEWLEKIIPGAEVWYGGDSSGYLASKFDEDARGRMFLYFCEVAHHPYHNGYSRIFAKFSVPVCPLCEVPMTSLGGGGDRTFYECTGCGQKCTHSPREVKWHTRHENWHED